MYLHMLTYIKKYMLVRMHMRNVHITRTYRYINQFTISAFGVVDQLREGQEEG
jgi:hypothetical protein